MRARMALKYSGVAVQLREVVLRDKPAVLLTSSAKGTVPVLVLADGSIIDESRKIMLWTLQQNDPEQWLPQQHESSGILIDELLDQNDFAFKNNLDRYKYPDRYPEQAVEYYRAQGELFLEVLEKRLQQQEFLMGTQISIADIGIFPFIRQFAHVDNAWFIQSPYPHLQIWLDYFLHSTLFNATMEKYPQWLEGSEAVVFC
ncbi:MAG: glutathione S-transferase [Methyloprofundus sp.]|nr:MAG: glutathione S-transferase [Methyloprofundus sp.]